MKDACNWGKLSVFFDTVWYLAGVNFFFLAANVPLLLFLLLVGAGRAGTYLPLFLLCLLPMAPALSAVFYSMNRYFDKKDLGAFRDFQKGWRGSLTVSLKAGALQLLFVFILWTNLRFFGNRPGGLIPVVISALLLLFAVVMTPNLYYLAGIYDRSAFDTFKSSIAMTLGKPGTTLGGAAAFCVVLLLSQLSPALAVLFFAGIYGFLVTFMNRNLIKS